MYHYKYICEKVRNRKKDMDYIKKISTYENYVDYNRDKICLVDERRDKTTATNLKQLIKKFLKSC